MKPLSERDENITSVDTKHYETPCVGMKPLSERDENRHQEKLRILVTGYGRNEATL